MTPDKIRMTKEKPNRTPESRLALELEFIYSRVIPSFLGMAVFILPSCSLPTVNLGTPEPIKVDVSMRLNVYQYRGEEPAQPSAEQKGNEDATERQRNRMAEIQTLKDNRLVAEDHRGLLHLREKPAGDWGARVEKAVTEENEDRMILMRREAKDGNLELHEVQAQQWKERTSHAFKGEWIEITGDKPNTFKWMKAVGVKTKQETKDEIKKEAAPPSTRKDESAKTNGAR